MWMKARFQGLGGGNFLVMGWWRCAARWGLHFHAWINLKGVTFLITFTPFWNFWVKKILFGRDFKMGSTGVLRGQLHLLSKHWTEYPSGYNQFLRRKGNQEHGNADLTAVYFLSLLRRYSHTQSILFDSRV